MYDLAKDSELRRTERLTRWIVRRQQGMLCDLIRAQELNVQFLRRQARKRLRGRVENPAKAETEARADLKTAIQPLILHLTDALGAEPWVIEGRRAKFEADYEAYKAARAARRAAREAAAQG
jgi:hypothetical protein